MNRIRRDRPTASTARQSLVRRTKAAIAAWVQKRGDVVVAIRHVQPRGYVVARLAESCLLVATPWVDAEPHMRERHKRLGVEWVHVFESSLSTGDWCSVAYVSTPDRGQPVAIQVVP